MQAWSYTVIVLLYGLKTQKKKKMVYDLLLNNFHSWSINLDTFAFDIMALVL